MAKNTPKTKKGDFGKCLWCEKKISQKATRGRKPTTHRGECREKHKLRLMAGYRAEAKKAAEKRSRNAKKAAKAAAEKRAAKKAAEPMAA